MVCVTRRDYDRVRHYRRSKILVFGRGGSVWHLLCWCLVTPLQIDARPAFDVRCLHDSMQQELCCCALESGGCELLTHKYAVIALVFWGEAGVIKGIWWGSMRFR